MDMFCENVDFEKENMKNLCELFEQRENQWIDKVVSIENIHDIWVEIAGKELFQSNADLCCTLLDYNKDKKIKRPLLDCNGDRKIKIPSLNNTEIITEKEGEFSAVLEKAFIEGIQGDIEVASKDSISPYIERIRMVEKIEPIRDVLYSEHLLADILINIYYSIYFYYHKGKFCELYDDDKDFPEAWKLYCKKGRTKNRRNDKGNNESGRERAVDIEKSFIEVTGNKLPISCRMKSRSNQGPLIQDVIPNVFRMFIMNPEFVDKYKLGNFKKYENVKDAYTKYNYSLSEQYILEEILGVCLSRNIFCIFQKLFSQLSFNVVTKGEEKLKLLIQKLLCWKGQYSRILITQKFFDISEEEIRREMLLYDGINRKVFFVQRMMDQCIQWTDKLNEMGNIFYKVLYREMLYVLWVQADGKLEEIARRCENYLKAKKYLPADNMPQFGKCNKSNSREKEIEMYCWIQKYVLNEIINRTETGRL